MSRKKFLKKVYKKKFPQKVSHQQLCHTVCGNVLRLKVSVEGFKRICPKRLSEKKFKKSIPKKCPSSSHVAPFVVDDFDALRLKCCKNGTLVATPDGDIMVRGKTFGDIFPFSWQIF